MLYKLFPRLRLPDASSPARSRDSFVYIDRGMSVVGWMPPKNPCGRYIYRLWSAFTTLFIIILLDVSLLISYSELSSFTARQFLTSLQVAFNCFGCSIKASYTFAGVRRLKLAKKILDRLDSRCETSEHRLQLQQTATLCNRIYMTYCAMYLLYSSSTFLGSMFFGRLAWNLYNPLVDAERGLFSFWLAGILEFLWMTGAVVQDLMADVYPIVYFLAIRTHIKMLKERLRNLRMDTNMSEEENYKQLIRCIEDHRLILDYCNTLRPVVSATIFVQFVLIGIVMGLSAINVIFFSNFWTGLGTGIFMFDLILQTFPFCYICNMIYDDCYEMANCLFHSNWLTADRQYRTTLCFFLSNVQKPIIFTAGGIFVISTSSNIAVAKLAFSVVTFVRQLNIAEKFYD
ncbi:PREDICTED: odorant receptor 42b-like [Drosophila arizonae]|uniref:Odorant receptor n=1 Tax=Drosophila arizonae TaxID=7263 RepID=A0ABM1NNX8_DROAR|nr:PREDICTED: odorant receptor 42b-like [Drosophila arizonae]